MDVQFVLILHGSLALVAVAALCSSKLWNVALSLGLFAVADGLLLRGAPWQTETALAFVGPLAVVIATARTVGASVAWSAAISAPVVGLAGFIVARGVALQVPGIAWGLASANLYAAVAGLWLLRIGARQISRLAAVTTGLLVATSAPAIVGWSLLARGHSVRAATVIDCVFLFAIVVASLAEWIRRFPNTPQPQSQAPFSGR